jgi:hypothetical protein
MSSSNKKTKKCGCSGLKKDSKIVRRKKKNDKT